MRLLQLVPMVALLSLMPAHAFAQATPKTVVVKDVNNVQVGQVIGTPGGSHRFAVALTINGRDVILEVTAGGQAIGGQENTVFWQSSNCSGTPYVRSATSQNTVRSVVSEF